MKIEILEISGLIPALRALRLPHGKVPRSEQDVTITSIAYNDTHKQFKVEGQQSINNEDLALAKRLVLAGDAHAKALRGVMVYLDITAPIYWWRELETHRMGHERLSCESTMHIECKGLSGEELQKVKSEIKMGHEQRAIDVYSYQCLRNIYKLRKSHRLPEWHQFCDIIEKLPFAYDLIIPEY